MEFSAHPEIVTALTQFAAGDVAEGRDLKSRITRYVEDNRRR